MKKLKQTYENLDRWLENRGEKVITFICLTALTALILSFFNILSGFR